MTIKDIEDQSNSETKRILIELYGSAKYLIDSGLTPIQKDDWGTLYDVGTHRVVHLLNSTEEPDGGRREYWIECPKECDTAHAAVAWSYGETVETYRPVVMT